MSDDRSQRPRFDHLVLGNGHNSDFAVNYASHLEVTSTLMNLREAVPPEDVSNLATGEPTQSSQRLPRPLPA